MLKISKNITNTSKYFLFIAIFGFKNKTKNEDKKLDYNNINNINMKNQFRYRDGL